MRMKQSGVALQTKSSSVWVIRVFWAENQPTWCSIWLRRGSHTSPLRLHQTATWACFAKEKCDRGRTASSCDRLSDAGGRARERAGACRHHSSFWGVGLLPGIWQERHFHFANSVHKIRQLKYEVAMDGRWLITASLILWWMLPWKCRRGSLH